MIRSFFVDGIFGNVIRFIFDRFFGGIFTNNINFSNIINLKNCHFKDLTIDADKINSKLFKNSPFQLFSGHIGSFSIKFPSLNALLTESLEVRLDKLDIVLVMNDVDFSKAEQEINAQLAKNNIVENPLEANEEHNVGGSGAQDFDVYKKIINRILFNMKLKVENICIRIVAEKPYKKVRLPIAPCFMLKIAKIEVKKNFEQGANAEPQKEMPSNMLFDKNQNYDIHIYGITLHMMANYELKPDEFLGKNVDPKAEFPFTYPTEAHPSTFFICACRKLKKSKTDDPAAIDQDTVEPISIRINFSNDRSKSVDINIPNIEIMIDFLKIKFLSRYVDKIMEWKKYMDYKKALQEQILSQRKSPQPGPMEGPHLQKLRKESFDLDGTQKKRLSEGKHPSFNNLEGNLMPNPNTAGTNSKIRIAGYDIDLNYFQKTNTPEGTPEEGEKPAKDMNLNLEGLGDLVSEPFELTADNILDTSNVHINLNVKSIYIYVLKTCSAFLEIEFRRRWLFGGDPQTDLHKSFNKKIPINYFQLKCTNLNLSMHTKDGSTTLSFNTFKILDVTKIETPLKLRSSNINSNPMPSASGFTSGFKSQFQNPWNKSEVFHSFRMDKSMMTSGLKFPELKRNISSDPNESMLFQSAISDVTKDFLTMREVRKQIVDWDLDPKREHFCVNVIFKFNKPRNMDFSKNKKDSESFKTVKYLDDSIIHSPLNTDPLTKEVPNAPSRPTLRFQAKGPKIVASLELPPVYVNFYMGIVHDINFLLHNASDSYKIMENWYLEQNQNLIRKWEQELREVAKQEDQQQPQAKEPASGSRRRESEAQERERIDEMVEAFYKRQNQLLSLDVAFIVPFIKIAVNLENTKKDNNQCFCGFSSHYFADNLAYTPLFKKDFVITELYQLMIKVNKVPSSEYFYQNTKKIPALQTHVLFQNLDIYVPSKMKDENKVLMMKLLSVHPIQSEGKLIVPSIMLTTYEDSNSVLVGKSTEPTSRKESSEPISENRRKDSSKNKKGSDKIEEEEKKMDFGNKAYDNKKADSWATSQKIYCAYFQKHMNKHMAADLDYLKLLDENATASLKVTLPKFEVFVSKHTLEFLRSFSKDGLTLVEDLNTKLAQLIDQEKRLFTSFFETTKPQKVPPIANLSLYIEEISINLFQDEKVNQNFHQIVEAKNKFKRNVNFAESDVFLDASFSASRMERSFSAPPITPHISEMRCHYPEKDFERALESSVKIIFRQSEAIVYKNPKEFVETIHLEIHDLLVVDKLQEKPQFGSFQINPVEGLIEAVIEYLDEEKQHEAHECIIYKQSCWNSWSKPLSDARMLKEPEGFSELKNKGIFIIENPHVAFNFKNKNVLTLGVLKSIQEERQKVEIEARVGFLVFRSDLRFGFVDVLNDIASCFKQNPNEKKEENNNDHSVYSIEKREIHEEPSLSIQVSLENIMVDINPYVNFDYCKTFGKINFGIDPDSLDFDQQRDMLYYSDIRSLVALESFTLKLNKKGSKVQFDRFEISSLDVLLRQQKPDPNLKENKILLRSKEDSFFEREFEELTHLYGYKSHPVYLSGLSLVSLGEDMKKLELKLSKVELNLYADTIPTIEKHLHLILCLIEKRKQINNEQSDVIVEEQKESEREYNMMSSKQEGSGKPKDNVIVADEIEIDKEYFKPLDENLRSKQSIHIKKEDEEEKDYEDVLDEDDMQSVEAKVNNDSFETVNSMPSISTSYLSSSTIFNFDEENLHNFSLGNQVISKKLTFKIEEVCLRVFESYEFDSDPILMEIPLAPSEEINSSRSGESQTILMSHDQSKIEKLPKTVNVNEKSECIMVVLESFSMGLLLFNKNDELKTNLAWRASVMLENFEILDCFKNSKKGEAKVKLFSKYKQMSPNFRPIPLNSSHGSNIVKISNTFDAIFECFEHEKCQQKDLRAFVVIHPIEIYFGTPHYNFTKLFLAKMNLKSPAPQVKNSDEGIVQSKSLSYSGFQKPKRSSEIFISFFHIAPVELKMNLNLDISIINLDLFQNLTLSFPSLVIRGAEDSGDLKKEAIEFYTRRVKKQLGKFIKDLPILRNIKNLTSATFNIFYSPYLNYRESGNLLYGLKDGFFGFVGSVSNESANLFTFLTTMVDNAANLTGIRERLSGRPDSQQNQ